MKKKLAILGASLPQKVLVEQAKKMNLETHVFAWDEGNIVKEIADFCYPISTLDKENILKVCKEIGIDGILTVGSDIALESINYVTENMNLIGNNYLTTQLCRDKHLMREIFEKNNIPSIKYKLIQTIEDLNDNLVTLPYMVKATDRSGSRGITFVKTMEEAKLAYQEALEVSINKKVIIEEYFEGNQYSVEVISENGNHYFVGITEEFYTGKPHFVEKAHVVPGRISPDLLKKTIELTYKTLDVLNVKNGASHTELRINDNNEFCIIEVAARMGGDFRAEMVQSAYDYNFLESSINVALGIPINYDFKSPKNYAFVKWLLNKSDLELINHLENYKILDQNIYGDTNEDTINSSEKRFGYILGESVEFPEIVLK
jgi:biotin carboxylase